MKYDFFCEKCGKEKTITHGMKEKHPKVICDKCKIKMERKISASAVHFKGTGWSCSDKNDSNMMKSVHPEAEKMHREGKI